MYGKTEKEIMEMAEEYYANKPKPQEQPTSTPPVTLKSRALEAILTERSYQERRWGEENSRHTQENWATIMSVYSGKVSAETKPYARAGDSQAFMNRVAQLGAICLAAYEAMLLSEETDAAAEILKQQQG